MIPRYSRDAMAQIWSDDRRYRAWFEVEYLATEALSKREKSPRARFA